MKQLDEVTAERDNETRATGEQQMTAVVHAAARKERAALERMLVLESSLRDVAAGAGASLADLKTRIDQGMKDLTSLMDQARR
jgi:hypothetical protein